MSTLRVVVLVLAALPNIASAEEAAAAKPASNKVVAVTVYQTSALVTREVAVPDAQGVLELIVSPLPPTAVLTSLYSEGGNGLRILSTRGRTRAVMEDTHVDNRKIESEIKALQAEQAKLQSDLRALEANSQLLTKLEGFTSASLTHLTEKGQLNSEGILTLAKQIMDQRSALAKEIVANQQKTQGNQEKIEFLQRQLSEMGTKSSRTEVDCVIIVDKANPGAATIRLNYLVEAASWKPQYKLRSGKPKDAVTLEYLAGVEQHTGEDWSGVRLTLSTAQPQLNAAPPDLKSLEVTAIAGGGAPMGGVVPGEADAGKAYLKLQEGNRNVRAQARGRFNVNDSQQGSDLLNSAAAREQAWDLCTGKEGMDIARGNDQDGPTVTFRLQTLLSLPSRSDEQIVEVTRFELTPEYYYKAVPVLAPHVYREANLTNKSEYVLLTGEATMYAGTDFVGRSTLPLVAIGENFTAGFGVDPQLQVTRKLVDKNRITQGGNQVLDFNYRIMLSSYKSEPVHVQVWDRLPMAEKQTVAVTLVSQKPELSKDPLYLREERTRNLLRWDVTIEPGSYGEKSVNIDYEFKMELERNLHIGSVLSK